MRSSISRSRMLAAVTVLAGAALCGLCGLATSDLLCLAPVLLLVTTLALRRYPGERLLVAIAAARARGPRRARPARVSLWRAETRVPRGGLLMAFSLAVRPPPAGLSAAS